MRPAKEIAMNIDHAVDKEYEDKSLTEIAKAPVAALEGVSERQAQLLHEAFGITTVQQLANNRFFKVAQAITILAGKEDLA